MNKNLNLSMGKTRKQKEFKTIKPGFILSTLRWLATNEQMFVSGEQWQLFEGLANSLEGIIQTRGRETGIKLAKTSRNLIFLLLAV
jgi:hypothetical protein